MLSSPRLPGSPHPATAVCIVFVPMYNHAAYIDGCFQSLISQDYPLLHILAVDDGSRDGTRRKALEWGRRLEERGARFTLLTHHERLGPAGSKWTAIEFLQTHAPGNDVFVIVDGDDKLAFDGALSRIMREYADTKCLFTYGTMTGMYSDQTQPIPEGTTDIRGPIGRRPSDFIFGHPRSCITALLHTYRREDFLLDGEFLQKCTDWPFIFRGVETAGVDRTAHIPEVLYNYDLHPEQTTLSVGPAYKAKTVHSARHLLPRGSRLEENIHVLLCVFCRRTLDHTLMCLNWQTVTSRIVLHVINNGDAEFGAYVEDLIKHTALRFRVQLHTPATNLFGYARFLVARQVLASAREYIPYFVCIDDDQDFAPGFIASLWGAAKPHCVVAWYGAVFRRDVPHADINYWRDRTVSMRHVVACDKPEISEYDYAATCGCVIDSAVLRLTELFHCPLWYQQGIEDLWLSFVVRRVMRGRCLRLVTNQVRELPNMIATASWRNLKLEKTALLRLLTANGFLLPADKDFEIDSSVYHPCELTAEIATRYL